MTPARGETEVGQGGATPERDPGACLVHGAVEDKLVVTGSAREDGLRQAWGLEQRSPEFIFTLPWLFPGDPLFQVTSC